MRNSRLAGLRIWDVPITVASSLAEGAPVPNSGLSAMFGNAPAPGEAAERNMVMALQDWTEAERAAPEAVVGRRGHGGGMMGAGTPGPERQRLLGAWPKREVLGGDAPTGMVDADGYFNFSARDDDVIIMAGYRIGPFEVESALLSHAAVVEAAVIAVPDAVRGEAIEAYVVLASGHAASSGLVGELQRRHGVSFAGICHFRHSRWCVACDAAGASDYHQ